MECFQDGLGDSVAKPLTHHGEVVGLTELADDRGRITMGLLIRGETGRVGQLAVDIVKR